jgi:hypothetical protein
LVVVQPETNLVESTKALVDAQPESVIAVLDLGFALYPDSAQDIITGAELTGEITRSAAQDIALNANLDVSSVLGATAAGGNDVDSNAELSDALVETGETVETGDTFDTGDTGDTVDTGETIDTAAVDNTPTTTVDAPATTVDAPTTNTPAIAVVVAPTAPVGTGAGAGGSGGGDSTVSSS